MSDAPPQPGTTEGDDSQLGDAPPADAPQAYQVADNAPLTVGSAIGGSINLFFDAFGQLFWLAAASAVVTAMGRHLTEFSLAWLMSLMAMVITVYLYIAALRRVDAVFGRPSRGDNSDISSGLLLRVLGIQMGLVVAVTIVFLVGAGPGLGLGIMLGNTTVMLLGTIPGFFVGAIILLLCYFADLVAIFEGRKLTAAFLRSYQLIRSVPTWFFAAFTLLTGGLIFSTIAMPAIMVLAGVEDLVATVIVEICLHTLAFLLVVSFSYVTFQGILARANHGSSAPPKPTDHVAPTAPSAEAAGAPESLFPEVDSDASDASADDEAPVDRSF